VKTLKKTHPRRKQVVSRDDALPINPDFFYRRTEGWKFFGYAATQLDEKIKTGEIPTPIALKTCCRSSTRAASNYSMTRA
jgi:hypothetical protein